MKSLYLILVLALSATPGCSHSNPGSRQERAYAKYIKQSMIARDKRQAQFRREKAKMSQPDMEAPSEPQVTAQTSEGPQAVPSNSDSQ